MCLFYCGDVLYHDKICLKECSTKIVRTYNVTTCITKHSHYCLTRTTNSVFDKQLTEKASQISLQPIH